MHHHHHNHLAPFLLSQIVSGDYKLDDDVWAEVHDSAKDMISHMMVVDPAQRWSARQLLNHKWFEVRGKAWLLLPGVAVPAISWARSVPGVLSAVCGPALCVFVCARQCSGGRGRHTCTLCCLVTCLLLLLLVCLLQEVLTSPDRVLTQQQGYMQRLGAFTGAARVKRLALKLMVAAAVTTPGVLQSSELQKLRVSRRGALGCCPHLSATTHCSQVHMAEGTGWLSSV